MKRFRLCLAALAAAGTLTAAVMVAPVASARDAPPCVGPPRAGSIPRPRLSARLSIKPATNGHKVTITGALRTSSVAEAVQLGRSAGASFTLWAEDPDTDDQLPAAYDFNYVIHGDRCEGQVYFWSTRFYNSTTGWLNEDAPWADRDGALPGRDEVYAVVQFNGYRAATNRVYGYF